MLKLNPLRAGAGNASLRAQCFTFPATLRTGPSLHALTRSLLAALLGVGLGLFATWRALETGASFETIEAGPWRWTPRAALREADPYSRAGRARSGEIPMSPAEGLAFFATRDESGAPLDARCDYVIETPTPAARYWTLTALDADGGIAANANNRPALTSAQVVRDSTGRFKINASRRARAGDWLALPEQGGFMLALRLYDTPLSTQPAAAARAGLPRLRKERCA